MTASELRAHFNDTYGIDKEWPVNFVVDHETYANVCQEMFDFKVKNLEIQSTTYPNVIDILVGKVNGLMFRSVELILGEK